MSGPLVSIVLPTYNRAAFLPAALASIEAQTYRRWQLIVVDDGSTDDTPEIVRAWKDRHGAALISVRRDNGGAYAARNTGLDRVSGELVAFFDSDDLWLPHHLERCVDALVRHPEVDWAYAACRCIDEVTGEVLAPTTFEESGRPRPFLSLHARADGAIRVFEDEGVLRCQIEHGLYAGLQNSVIRSRVFAGHRFWEDYRVVEDVLFLIRALARGVRLAYIDDVHVVYRVHQGSSSASGAGQDPRRLLPIFEEQVRGYERVRTELHLPREAAAALDRVLAHVYFWRLGYASLWQLGQRRLALQMYTKALKLWPWDWRMWKTFVLASALRVFTSRSTDTPG